MRIIVLVGLICTSVWSEPVSCRHTGHGVIVEPNGDTVSVVFARDLLIHGKIFNGQPFVVPLTEASPNRETYSAEISDQFDLGGNEGTFLTVIYNSLKNTVRVGIYGREDGSPAIAAWATKIWCSR